MAILTNQRILLGVTGSVAAYKSADLARRLREAGAEVRVVMTRAACEFITPLTMQAVSGQRVHTHLLDVESESAMGHIELARWADAVVVAPAGANFVAKLAHGLADDLLSTLCLATRAPLAIAPGMNQQMWSNPATQANVATLATRGIAVFGPATGAQACGETGPGRMLEPAELVALTARLFESAELAGRYVLVTAGPTWEALDPVRGLSNKSSGKMGYAVAAAARAAGARVTLVSGPTQLPDPDGVHTARVTTALEMRDAVRAHIRGADIFIAVAAVADYRPAAVAADKIKKDAETLTLELVRNPDILASVAALRPAPFTVGFAAETGELESHARQKLEQKGVDLIAANRVGVPGTGFDADENCLVLLDRRGRSELPRMRKSQLARALIHEIALRYHAQGPAQDSRRAHRH